MDWETDVFRTKVKLMAQARQLFRYHPMRAQVKAEAKIMPYIYICAGCGQAICDRESGATEAEILAFKDNNMVLVDDKLHVDHIDPVGGLDKIDNLIIWLNRLFCDKMNLQLLCSCCHYFKTQQENDERKAKGQKLEEEEEWEK